MNTLQIRTPSIPEALQLRLARLHLRYTDIRDVFHLVWLDGENFCGVAGDGGNAAYEWFIFRNNELTTSDCGYGDTAIALRDVLVREVR